MAGYQNVALMLMQVLIQHISDMENEFMAWFHVFFLDDVIEIAWAAHGLFRETSHTQNKWIFCHNSVNALTLKFRKHFRMSRETVES